MGRLLEAVEIKNHLQTSFNNRHGLDVIFYLLKATSAEKRAMSKKNTVL